MEVKQYREGRDCLQNSLHHCRRITMTYQLLFSLKLLEKPIGSLMISGGWLIKIKSITITRS